MSYDATYINYLRVTTFSKPFFIPTQILPTDYNFILIYKAQGTKSLYHPILLINPNTLKKPGAEAKIHIPLL